MMRRRFLPFFPFPKPLPLLDIHDPRYFSLVSTHRYASPTEKFPCPARLDDGRGVWSGPCARVSGSWRGFRDMMPPVSIFSTAGKDPQIRWLYRETLRSRKALAMTETELKLIAALASMGLSSQPKMG